MMGGHRRMVASHSWSRYLPQPAEIDWQAKFHLRMRPQIGAVRFYLLAVPHQRCTTVAHSHARSPPTHSDSAADSRPCRQYSAASAARMSTLPGARLQQHRGRAGKLGVDLE